MGFRCHVQSRPAGRGHSQRWSLVLYAAGNQRGDAAFVWRNASPVPFTAVARPNGNTVSSVSFTRQLLPDSVNGRTLTPVSAGFAGEMFAPVGGRKRPAVLVIGGSSGGLPTFQAAALSAAGYPALAIAYFNYRGLPSTLSRIPLEYFARALGWLARQPGVDPSRILTLGVSRGSEAALLLGVHYPRLELPRFRRHLNASGGKPGRVRFRCPELGRRIPMSSAGRRSV